MEIVFNIQDLIHETIISEQEGRALMEKTKEVAPWAGLSYGDKKRVINNLHEFIVLINGTNTKTKLSLKQKESLINPVLIIIDQIELSQNYENL